MRIPTIAIAATLLVLPATAFADGHLKGDPAKGKKVFKKCRACHVVDSEKKKIGPSLKDIIGRQAGTKDGFKYSKAMIKAGEDGLKWDDKNLHGYLAAPRKFIPKNSMAFAGLKKEQQRADVIAYLKQFSPAD